MSGVLIAGVLLHADVPLLALVPVEWIVAWELPENAPSTAIVVDRISALPLQLLAPEATRRINERVQVTIRATSGEDLAVIEAQAVKACADRTGTIAGFAGVSVLYLGGGPNVRDDAGNFLTSFDLRVSFLEPA